MIEVSLSERGNAQYAIQGVSTLGDAEPMYVTECFRCIGSLILFTRKPEVKVLTAQYLVMGFHIPPGPKDWARAVSHNIFRDIRPALTYYRPVVLGICGGKIDTPTNRKFYDIMQGQFIAPLKRLLPEAHVVELKPKVTTEYSTLYMDEEFHFIVESF